MSETAPPGHRRRRRDGRLTRVRKRKERVIHTRTVSVSSARRREISSQAQSPRSNAVTQTVRARARRVAGQQSARRRGPGRGAPLYFSARVYSSLRGRAPAPRTGRHLRMGSIMSLRRILSCSTIALVGLTPLSVEGASGASLRGTVESAATGLVGYQVPLSATSPGGHGTTRILGRATTGAGGQFEIQYELPGGLPSPVQPLLFVRAERGQALLASVIGQAPVAGPVVVNERTTLATGFAFAQFVDGSVIEGNRYGVLNAVRMAANMAAPRTGAVADVLRLPPNGPETTGLPTFNSLANVVASCVAAPTGCQALFDATTVPGGARPTNVLQAVANIAKYPWLNVGTLFSL